MSRIPPASIARRIRRRTLGIVTAVALLPAAVFGVGFGGRYALHAYNAIAAHNTPIVCGGAMQPCVKVR